MKTKRVNVTLIVAVLWIAVSVISLFIGVISYEPPGGVRTNYTLLNLLDGNRFTKEVLCEYTGSFRISIGTWTLTLLSVLAITAILAALIGVIVLSKQRPTRWPYIMTILGCVGTAIPSILIFAAVMLSRSYFPGNIRCGFYPIVTPIAMAICLWLVVQERRRKRKAKIDLSNAADLLRPGGDLE